MATIHDALLAVPVGAVMTVVSATVARVAEIDARGVPVGTPRARVTAVTLEYNGRRETVRPGSSVAARQINSHATRHGTPFRVTVGEKVSGDGHAYRTVTIIDRRPARRPNAPASGGSTRSLFA